MKRQASTTTSPYPVLISPLHLQPLKKLTNLPGIYGSLVGSQPSIFIGEVSDFCMKIIRNALDTLDQLSVFGYTRSDLKTLAIVNARKFCARVVELHLSSLTLARCVSDTKSTNSFGPSQNSVDS